MLERYIAVWRLDVLGVHVEGLHIYLFINSGLEFNTSITQIQGSQQQQNKPEKERKGYK